MKRQSAFLVARLSRFGEVSDVPRALCRAQSFSACSELEKGERRKSVENEIVLQTLCW